MERAENQIQKQSADAGDGTQRVPLLVFGEVLFDCFSDGRRILGGAPFNVAWGLKGFGRDPVMVSAVGEDSAGRAVRDQMAVWGLRTEGLQTDSDHSTGEVRIELAKGEPHYDICAPRAWDFIGDEGFCATKLLCHGLLALRDEASRRTFAAIQARSAGAIRFFDVNLRPPYNSLDLLRPWVQGVDWLKLNIDELATLLDGKTVPFAESEADLERLREKYGIRNVLLTAGAEGLCLHGDYGTAVCSPAPPLERLVDTVGAGDSISAVAIDGILRGASAQEIVVAAGRFASKICGLNGAIAGKKEFYRYE